MSNGKHSVNKESNNSSKKKKFKWSIFLPFLLFLILCVVGIYFLVNHFNKSNSNLDTTTKPVEYEDSRIEFSRYVDGLDALQILGLDIKSAETSSKISISLKNISDNNIEPCKLIFSMLDESGHRIFSTSLNVPLISANEETTLKVFCTDDLSTAIDYDIEFDK